MISGQRKYIAAKKFVTHITLIFLGLPCILPLIWMLSTSLKTPDQIYQGNQGGAQVFHVQSIIPSPVRWQNYPDALKSVPFGRYIINTMFLCSMTVLAIVFTSACVAYSFSRIRYPGRDLYFCIMVATMALPGQVTMIPVFSMMSALGWCGTFLPLIVPSFFGGAFYIFLLKQFFQTIPEEILEAARIDGAGEFKIFSGIMLPLAKPALATVALFQFLGVWNDFFGPLIYINNPKMYTLAYGLQQFLSAYGGKWSELMAGACIFTIPIIVLFFLAQRTFIQGIVTTGSKS